MPETQIGSCEPCKKKKCKCDRKTPTCSQCTCLPSLCNYAENSKRGIPSGYLGALEQRLNETEVALYNTLSELRRLKLEGENSLRPEHSMLDSSRIAKLTKVSRMAEWKQYPLRAPQDMENWWQGLGCDDNRLHDSPRTENSANFDSYQNLRPMNHDGSSQQLEASGFGEVANAAPSHPVPGFPAAYGAFEGLDQNARPNLVMQSFGSAQPSFSSPGPAGNGEFLQTQSHSQGEGVSVNAPCYNMQGRPWTMSQHSESSPQAPMAAPPARDVAPDTSRDRSLYLSKTMQHMYY